MSYKIEKYVNKEQFIVEYNHRQNLQIQDGAELVDGVYTEFTYALLPNEIMFQEEVEIEVEVEQGEMVGTHKETVTLNYPVVNPNYEEEQKQKEKERIARLNLTGADVERGIYKARGMDFDDIIAMVTQLQPEGLDIKALKIELKANNFYRGNPYVDAVGSLLGFTKEQLDKFFKYNDYQCLIEGENE